MLKIIYEMFSMVLVTGATIGGCKDPWETQKSDSQTGLQTRLQTYSGTLIIVNLT